MAAGQQGRHRRPGAADRNRELALRYVRDVVRDRDASAVEELFAPPDDWETVSLVGGTTVETYEELARYYGRTLPAFEDVTVESTVAEGSRVTVRWRATGEVTDEFPGLPATGSAFETTAVTEFRFDAGRIVELHVQVNEMDLLPDVAWPAVRGVVEEMRDGVVVLDDEERVVHVNGAFLELVDADRGELLGERAAALLGEDSCPPGGGTHGAPTGESPTHRPPADDPPTHHASADEGLGPATTEGCPVTTTEDGRHLSVGTSPLRGEDGERLGRMAVVRDVTERRRRLQQLDVLNRVLQHNLRNALQVVQGRLTAARDRGGEGVAELLAPATDRVAELLDTAETARLAQAALEETGTRHHDLADVAASLVARARDRWPAASIEASVPAGATVEASAALETALWELVENAIEHGGQRPDVEIRVTRRGDRVALTVADDGPGLPAHEREVLAAGRETALDHGSGLGLWLAKWVVTASGGRLRFDVDDGTTVRVTLPVAPDGAAPVEQPVLPDGGQR